MTIKKLLEKENSEVRSITVTQTIDGFKAVLFVNDKRKQAFYKTLDDLADYEKEFKIDFPQKEYLYACIYSKNCDPAIVGEALARYNRKNNPFYVNIYVTKDYFNNMR